MSDKKKEVKEEKPAATEGAPEGAEAAPKKSKKKLIILAVAGLVLIGGVAGALFATGVIGGEEKPVAKKEHAEGEEEGEEHAEEEEGGHSEEAEESEEGEEHAEEEGEEGEKGKGGKAASKKPVFFDLPDIVVNLNSPTPRPHFINLKMTLEVAGKKNVKTIEEQMPRVIDSFNSYLREIRKDDLQGSAGMYRLENELMLRLEKLFGKGVVTDILFREIIVQ